MKNLSRYLALSLLVFLGACSDEPTPTEDVNYVVMAFPSPARDVAWVYVQNATSSYGSLAVYDPEGDRLLGEEVAPGAHAFTVQITSDGKYHVAFKVGNKTYTTTFLAL